MPKRVFAKILLMVLTLLPVCATAQPLPSWPQTRTIPAGATAWFTIPVTRTGPATLTLTWKNGPLSAKVITPGNATIPVATTSSPVTVPLNITAAEVQKGPVWSVSLTVPPAARSSAPVEATLNYKGPEADSSALQAYASRMTAGLTAASADAAKAFEQTVNKQITANQQALTTQIATQKLNLSKQLLTPTKAIPAVSVPLTTRPSVNLTQTGGGIGGGGGSTSGALPSPVISSVNPSLASAGIWVTLNGQNFAATHQVFFVTETGTEVPAPMRFQNATALQAQVPAMGDPANTLRTVTICLKGTVNGTAVKSNSIAFQLVPPPTITTLDRPSGLPGESLLVNGVGFQNPIVHFQQAAGGKDYAVSPKANEWNAAQVYVTLPEIPLVPITGMQLNVTVESNGMRSAPKSFTLKPIEEEKVLPEVAWKNFKVQDGSDRAYLYNGCAYLDRYANGIFDFHNGTDTVAPTVILRNGWRVVRIETTSKAEFVDFLHGHVTLSVPPVTAADLTVKVDWWVRSQGGAYATVAYIIKGPKGVPYK